LNTFICPNVMQYIQVLPPMENIDRDDRTSIIVGTKNWDNRVELFQVNASHLNETRRKIFFDRSIAEKTWVVEMRIWCIKIGNVLVLHFEEMWPNASLGRQGDVMMSEIFSREHKEWLIHEG
jgi:hypothetical protein